MKGILLTSVHILRNYTFTEGLQLKPNWSDIASYITSKDEVRRPVYVPHISDLKTLKLKIRKKK